MAQQGHEILDVGTHSSAPVDYPDIAEAVATALRNGQVDRGIIVCGSGAGVSVAANKFPGVRAAVCHDGYTARQAVEHDDLNVMCLGARVIGPALARTLVEAFLAADVLGRGSPPATARQDRRHRVEVQPRISSIKAVVGRSSHPGRLRCLLCSAVKRPPCSRRSRWVGVARRLGPDRVRRRLHDGRRVADAGLSADARGRRAVGLLAGPALRHDRGHGRRIVRVSRRPLSGAAIRRSTTSIAIRHWPPSIARSKPKARASSFCSGSRRPCPIRC